MVEKSKKTMSLENCIRRHGEIEGQRIYFEWRESRKGLGNLNWYINKYGKDEGTKMYQEKSSRLSNSRRIEGYIEKYGKELGPLKYKQKNSNLSVGEKTYLKKGFSKEEIDKRKKVHKEKSLITEQSLIIKYGEKEGKLRWQKRLNNAKKTSRRCIEYWLEKNDGDLKKAKSDLADFQKRDLNFFKVKYGDIKGIEKYQKSVNKKIKEMISYNVSKAQLELENKLRDELKDYKIYGNDYGYVIFPNKKNRGKYKNIKTIVPDIIINKKVIVEYYGNYWHANPELCDENFYNKSSKMSAKDIWLNDSRKKEILEDQGYKVFIVWEKDWNQDKDQVLENLLNKIKEELK